MSNRSKEVSTTLFDPDREDCLRALSLAFLRVLASGVTVKELARRLQVDPSTVTAARDESHLIGFDTIMKFAVRFPEEYQIVEQLRKDASPEPKTPADHVQLAAYHLEMAQRKQDVADRRRA